MDCKLHAFQTASLTELTTNINNFLKTLENGDYNVEFHFYEPVPIFIGSQQKTVFSAIVMVETKEEDL